MGRGATKHNIGPNGTYAGQVLYDVLLARCERAEAEVEQLRAACELALDFHGADTEAFVARYGHGMTTRDLCDRLREVLAHHPTPQAGEQEQP